MQDADGEEGSVAVMKKNRRNCKLLVRCPAG
jgi:hypothetical protein